MKIGLVILNYNDSPAVDKLLERVGEYASFAKIVVVDNASPDGSYDRLAVWQSDKIDVLQTEKNGGYAFGNNFGVRHLMDTVFPDVILIANPDVSFSEETVKKMAQALEDHPDYGVVGCMRDGENDPRLAEFYSFKDSLLECFALYRLYTPIRAARYAAGLAAERPQKYPELLSCDVVTGDFLAVNTAHFARAGMMDEHTFLYYEEQILGRRMKAAGYKEGLITTASHGHVGGGSIGKSHSRARIVNNFLDSKIYYEMNYAGRTPAQRKILRAALRWCRIENAVIGAAEKLFR